MKYTRVQYTVQKDFVEANKRNIEKVMEDVRNLNAPGLKYATWLMEDGVTFMHLAMMQSDEDAQLLNSVESFGAFRKALKESEPIPPENAIGRVSRMDAINNKSVNEAALRQCEAKLSKLQLAMGRIDEPDFGKCVRC